MGDTRGLERRRVASITFTTGRLFPAVAVDWDFSVIQAEAIFSPRLSKGLDVGIIRDDSGSSVISSGRLRIRPQPVGGADVTGMARTKNDSPLTATRQARQVHII